MLKLILAKNGNLFKEVCNYIANYKPHLAPIKSPLITSLKKLCVIFYVPVSSAFGYMGIFSCNLHPTVLCSPNLQSFTIVLRPKHGNADDLGVDLLSVCWEIICLRENCFTERASDAQRGVLRARPETEAVLSEVMYPGKNCL